MKDALMKDKDLLKLMLSNDWKLIRINGSHHVLQKNNQTEVIPIHGKDVPTGLLTKILKRTGLKR
jgi:predicted RNA binding protein YcfA (HicA-like mRNA interferase family)